MLQTRLLSVSVRVRAVSLRSSLVIDSRKMVVFSSITRLCSVFKSCDVRPEDGFKSVTRSYILFHFIFGVFFNPIGMKGCERDAGADTRYVSPSQTVDYFCLISKRHTK